MREITVLEDPGAAVADRLGEVAVAGGNIVLTGGSTPRSAYARAAEQDADWSKATVWFSDPVKRLYPWMPKNTNDGKMSSTRMNWNRRVWVRTKSNIGGLEQEPECQLQR